MEEIFISSRVTDYQVSDTHCGCILACGACVLRYTLSHRDGSLTVHVTALASVKETRTRGCVNAQRINLRKLFL
jgi:hypothetical protein